MTIRRLFALVAVASSSLFLLGGARAARGEDEQSPDVKLRITNVSLFKNGTGFVVSRGKLPDNARSVRLGQLPVPSFGTFWVGYGKDLKLRSLVASMENVREKSPLQNVDQLLELNVGRKVVLGWGSDKVEGILLPRVKRDDVQESPGPYFMGGASRQDRSETVPFRAGMFLVKTEKGIVALNAGNFSRAEFEGGDVVDSTWITRRRPSIRMDLDAPSDGEDITVSYLARGITWTPGYLVDLSDPERAKFHAHALVVNELTDFTDVKLEFVTGFPNVAFADVSSPIAMTQDLASFLNALGGGGSGSSRSWADNRMMQQQAVMVNEPMVGRETGLIPGYSTATEGQTAEDLFFYPVKSFTLKRNETAWVPLFSAEMPYKHVYVWKIGDFLDEEDRYQPERETPGAKKGEEVWHCCRLVNTLKMPLTTAATEFMTDGQLTGQDICYYTAPRRRDDDPHQQGDERAGREGRSGSGA